MAPAARCSGVPRVTRKSFVRYWPVARKTAAVKRVIGIISVDSIVPEEWHRLGRPRRMR